MRFHDLWLIHCSFLVPCLRPIVASALSVTLVLKYCHWVFISKSFSLFSAVYLFLNLSSNFSATSGSFNFLRSIGVLIVFTLFLVWFALLPQEDDGPIRRLPHGILWHLVVKTFSYYLCRWSQFRFLFLYLVISKFFCVLFYVQRKYFRHTGCLLGKMIEVGFHDMDEHLINS